MSDEYRFGDETPPAERSERLYREATGDAWFFRTREGAPMGPFETVNEAQQALTDFIEFIRLADLQTLSELTQSLAGGTAGEAVRTAALAAREAGRSVAVAAAVPVASRAQAAGSVGAWDPAVATALPSTALLLDLSERFIANGEATARTALDVAEVEQLAGWMQADAAVWPPVLGALSTETLITLVRFFTLAEQELPGWQAGRKSPAIACARELRQRSAYPAPLTAWIRQHSDNRFLPYGSLLDRL